MWESVLQLYGNTLKSFKFKTCWLAGLAAWMERLFPTTAVLTPNKSVAHSSMDPTTIKILHMGVLNFCSQVALICRGT
jgi:hypothetical protein